LVTRDAQVRVLLAELAKHGEVGVAAARAGMDRKTARKWLRTGQMPSEVVVERKWRTRDDPFVEALARNRGAARGDAPGA
jgi:hypothetical protein